MTSLQKLTLCVILPSYNLQQLQILNCARLTTNAEPSVLPDVPEMQASSEHSKLWPLLPNPLKTPLFCRLSLLTLSCFSPVAPY